MCISFLPCQQMLLWRVLKFEVLQLSNPCLKRTKWRLRKGWNAIQTRSGFHQKLHMGFGSSLLAPTDSHRFTCPESARPPLSQSPPALHCTTSWPQDSSGFEVSTGEQ